VGDRLSNGELLLGTKARSPDLLHQPIDIRAVFRIHLAEQAERSVLGSPRDFEDTPLSGMMFHQPNLHLPESLALPGQTLAKMFAQLQRIQHRRQCRDAWVHTAI